MGQKQKTEKKKKEILNDDNDNGQLRIANATSGGAHKAAWAKIVEIISAAAMEYKLPLHHFPLPSDNLAVT